jgi:hypothetical protein
MSQISTGGAERSPNSHRGKNDTGRMHRPEPGSWADRSINGFCIRHCFSRSTYVKRRNEGLGPIETQSKAGGKISISEQAERDHDARFARGTATITG